MAKCDLNGIAIEEIQRNSNSSFAASIISGEIFRVTCRHSKKGNIILSIEGKALNCRDFNGDNFTTEGCFLYNPALTRAIVEACDDSDTPVFIVAGEVTKTAPATSDTVVSKTDLQKEAAEIQNGYFALPREAKAAADARLAAIEKLLKTA